MPSTRFESKSRNFATPKDDLHNRQQQPNVGRKKRARESNSLDDHMNNPKRTRLVIEIKARSNVNAKTRPVVNPRANSDVVPPATTQTLPPEPEPEPEPEPDPDPAAATQPEIEVPKPPTPKPIKHHDKVANGIQHELDRLQVNKADIKEKRSLRSQEGTRFKSDLSLFFVEYDEVIGNDPKDPKDSKFLRISPIESRNNC